MIHEQMSRQGACLQVDQNHLEVLVNAHAL